MSTLKIPDGNFKAFLFDCDGTIADTMPLHFKAWNEALAPWGCRFENELFYSWAGIPIAKTVEMLNDKYRLSMPVAEVVRRREEAYQALLPHVRPVESVLPHIENNFGKIPLAVVSGSHRESVIRTLKKLGLLDRFTTIVGSEDYTHGKPSPEPFLRAAEILKVAPENCLVFEDAELGIQSAINAGMKWVRV